MKSPQLASLPITLVLVLVAMLPVLSSSSQDSPPRRVTETAVAQPRKSGYDLEIQDGKIINGPKGASVEANLGNVIDALREIHPEANFAMPPGFAKLRIADLKLRAGNLWEELEAVRVASGGKFEWSGPGINMVFGAHVEPGSQSPTMLGTPDPQTGLIPAGVRANSGLFVLREPAPTEETMRVVEAFNIGSYLELQARGGRPDLFERADPAKAPDPSLKEQRDQEREKRVQMSLEQLKEIIMQTIAALQQGHEGRPEQPGFQFHPGAALLVVIGSREAVDVARKVVNALPGQPPSASFQPGAPPAQDDALRRRYGLRPNFPPGRPTTTPQDDAFRKRYGLDPTPPTQPASPDPSKQPQ